MSAPGTPVADQAWRAGNAQWLALRLERLRLRLVRRALWRQRAQPEGVRSADWIVAGDAARDEAAFFDTDADVAAVEATIAALDARLDVLETQLRETSRPPALRALAELAGLSPRAEELLLLAAAPGLDGAFGQACAELQDDPRRNYATLHLALGVLGTDPAERLLAPDELMPGRPLRALRLLEVEDAGGEPLLTSRLAVDERLTDFLRGINRIDRRLVPWLGNPEPALAAGGATRAAAEVAALITTEPERWATVNLVGPRDRGARDVAAQACAELGLGLGVLDIARFSGCPPDEQEWLMALLGREALLGGVAVLVDTEGIERGSPAAQAIDGLIDRLAATLFLVGPDRWPGRPDAHVVEVQPPSRAEQGALWRAALAPHRHALNGEIDAVAQQFDFGPGDIAEVVARAGRRNGGEITSQALWHSCREQRGGDLDLLARRIVPCYGWDDIVVGSDLRAQLVELASQVEHRGRVYETWGFGARLGRGRGITALFAGPSGTGKTMAAEILAAHLDLDLYRIDLAGVVSKYVGETEKNLRRVFDAAERSGAILFFDEADALFGTRTEARDSHDRYANLEINYLLQRMEDYAGLAILATNRRAALDPAFLRRLRFVIEFPFPAIDERRRMWEGVFPETAERDELDLAFLASLEITGGNIRAIAINAAFLAAAASEPIGMAHLARAAAREYVKLAKPISAAEFGAYHEAARS